MAFPLFVLAMGIVARARQHGAEHRAAPRPSSISRSTRASPAPRPTCGARPASCRPRRLSGNGEFRILLGHILPNIMPIMIVQMSLTMGYAILNAAGLSFIGLGVRAADAGVGHHGSRRRGFMVSGEWWIAFFPGAALMIAVFCFNLLGDGLRDIVDPQRRT